jgi:hypothetical protein
MTRGRALKEATMKDVHERLFALSPDIRYVALEAGGRADLRSRPGLENASSAESDRYEELLVNPTLLTLARRRGDIDCGGLRYLVVGYGNFHQLVIPTVAGHVSVAVELAGDPTAHLRDVLEVVEGLQAEA